MVGFAVFHFSLMGGQPVWDDLAIPSPLMSTYVFLLKSTLYFVQMLSINYLLQSEGCEQ